MSISEFLILSIVIGAIAFSLLTVLILNGYQRCQFCAGFWISVILTIVYGVLFGFTFYLIPLPFCAVAFTHFINK